ncbi:MAG: exodeoxyribonuclease VII small subunit [Saprospiraceae bacterium]
MTYEEALAELQSIVQELQDGNISIDDLSEKITRASELIQYGREKLRKTELDLESLFSDKD